MSDTDPTEVAESTEALEAAATSLGVPEDAIRRLEEMRPGQPGALFTSDLSVNEFLLVREAGFRPVGLVLGSSIYHVGIQARRWGQNQELDTLSQAMYHAREPGDGANGGRGLCARRRRGGRGAARDRVQGVRQRPRGVRRGRHRGRGRRPRQLPQQSRPAVHVRIYQGRGFPWTHHPIRLRAARDGDGHLRLPHCPSAIMDRDLEHRAQRRDQSVHRGPLRRPRARDVPHAGRS